MVNLSLIIELKTTSIVENEVIPDSSIHSVFCIGSYISMGETWFIGKEFGTQKCIHFKGSDIKNIDVTVSKNVSLGGK